MQTTDPKKTTLAPVRNAPMFIIDDDGRTLFYPAGISSDGYIIPDSAHKQKLQKAIEKYNRFSQYFVTVNAFLAIPFLFGFYMLAGRHNLLAVDFGIATVAIVSLIASAVRRSMMDRLVQDLERVGPRDLAMRHFRRRLLAGAAAFPVIAWAALCLYGWRLAALPRSDDVAFFGDISIPIIILYMCGGMIAMFAVAPSCLRFHLDEIKGVLCGLIAGVFAFMGFVWTVALFLAPTPNIVLARTSFICGWNIPWEDIKAMKMAGSGRGRTYVVLSLDASSAPLAAAVPTKRPSACEISNLNVDYEDVYAAIRKSWEAHRTPAQ